MTSDPHPKQLRELAEALAQAVSYMVDREYGVEGTDGVGPPTGWLLGQARDMGLQTDWRKQS